MKNFTEEQVLAAVQNSGGLVQRVAEKLDCSWQTARTYIDRYPVARLELDTETQVLLDTAENVVHEALKAGDIQAAKWFLTTKGKDRGYADRLELESTTVTSIKVTSIPAREIMLQDAARVCDPEEQQQLADILDKLDTAKRIQQARVC